MKKIFVMFSIVLMAVSCSDNDSVSSKGEPTAKIVTVSDLHYFNPDYVDVSNPDYQTYLMMDRKLITESDALLNAFKSEMISRTDIEYIFIPGDITKDGEKTSHQKVATILRDIEASGKKIYVVPGNHDINNGMAMSFSGSTIPVDAVTPDEFSEIYSEFGYSEALYRDTNSLSYMVKLKDNLWLLGLDDCKYNSNQFGEHPHTDGKLSDATMGWIREKLEEAKSKNITVLGMIHHGIVPHFEYQPIMFPEYLTDDFATVSSELADNGLNVIFTGHYHANDIAKTTSINNNEIYDIETGSLVTYPCPYRIVELKKDRTLQVSTKHIENINFDLGNFGSFQDYALNYINTGLQVLVPYMLMQYGATQNQAEFLTPYMVKAFIAHYEGDETADQEDLLLCQQLIQSSNANEQMFGAALFSIWNDPAPADNNILIDLN
ncbi:MAG: metallophosphoesterase [Candidatus Delongbacteria bacterium]|nr:metallophosphoesterase [Candidatus Delongbacteria bacterium]MBN2834374.1 metallophosphoesterase [Candidatus Delongbacteria bacterium]